jgi:CheY-like chemotaxis protein
MIKPIHALLADDDSDDRFFFDLALKEQSILVRLSTAEDGEQLMNFLLKSKEKLPDIIFLDLNMPRKNGSECLSEIMLDKKLRHIPVIVYSTSLHEDIADTLYKTGAYYYIRKTDFTELQKILAQVLSLFTETKFVRPSRRNFILNLEKYPQQNQT